MEHHGDVMPQNQFLTIKSSNNRFWAFWTCLCRDLAKLGYDVTIFEAFHTAGGVLVYGIPNSDFLKQSYKKEIDKLSAMGVHIMTNMVIGKVLSIDELLEDMDFDAVLLVLVQGFPSFMGIEGEALVGVYSANEYLTRINLMKSYIEEYDTPIKKAKQLLLLVVAMLLWTLQDVLKD